LDSAVDAIVICSPNHTHYNVLQIVCESGKPILLEKPMATTLADAMEILRLAREYPSVIQLGMQYRFKAQYAEALSEIQARRLSVR
jgi:predicted dehydrogenase